MVIVNRYVLTWYLVMSASAHRVIARTAITTVQVHIRNMICDNTILICIYYNIISTAIILSIIDIDECSDTSHPPCHPNATCTNTNGSYVCDCRPGFYGSGFNCTG